MPRSAPPTPTQREPSHAAMATAPRASLISTTTRTRTPPLGTSSPTLTAPHADPHGSRADLWPPLDSPPMAQPPARDPAATPRVAAPSPPPHHHDLTGCWAVHPRIRGQPQPHRSPCLSRKRAQPLRRSPQRVRSQHRLRTARRLNPRPLPPCKARVRPLPDAGAATREHRALQVFGRRALCGHSQHAASPVVDVAEDLGGLNEL